MIWHTRLCSSRTHWRFYPTPSVRRGLHSWFAIIPHSRATLTHLLPLKNLVVSLALALNQFVDPWALDVMGWRYVSLSPLVP